MLTQGCKALKLYFVTLLTPHRRKTPHSSGVLKTQALLYYIYYKLTEILLFQHKDLIVFV